MSDNAAVSHTSIDFGYPWWLNYGHLALFGVLLAAVLAARAIGASWGSVAFGVGVEFIGVSLSVQCHPKVAVDYPSGQPAANAPCSLVQRMAI